MMNNTTKIGRLDLVDALRGFALLAIVLLHNLEHYNMLYEPEGTPAWLQSLDKSIYSVTFFMMAGKAFSTFSLLFGFSFYMQSLNALKRGYSFSGRFAWRMFLLFLFAMLHTVFYNGDILIMYAFIGLLIIPLNKLSNRTLLIVGCCLFLQPLEWGRIIYALVNPDYQFIAQINWQYWPLMREAMSSGTFIEVIKSNMTDGMLGNTLWQIENGRLFLIPALFIFGILLGRMKYFVKSQESIRFWRRVLGYGLLVIVPLYLLKTLVPEHIERYALSIPYNTAVPSIYSGVFMAILVAGFSLLWFRAGDGYKAQRFIIPYGRMSLTNYITQSIIGCFIYFGYGLGLYRSTGATVCILIGLAIVALQLFVSARWLRSHPQGPLEALWKRLTWIDKRF